MEIRDDLPDSLAEVDVDFLNLAVRDSQAFQDSVITDFDMTVIGEGAGFLGEIARIVPVYSPRGADAPDSMIMKLPTSGGNRNLGQMLGVYEREIRFYSDLRDRVNVRTPVLYYAGLNVLDNAALMLNVVRVINRLPLWLIKAIFALGNWAGGKLDRQYVLLMEDLGHLRVGDQVGGCTPEESEQVLDAMAAMHARYWNAPELADYPWVVPMEESAKLAQIVYLKGIDGFLTASEEWLTRRERALLEWLRGRGDTFLETVCRPPFTLLHGDFRPDNLCFDDARGEVVLFDWQTCLAGPPGTDLAYFLSSCVAPGMPVDGLLAGYRDALKRHGIEMDEESVRRQFETGLVLLVHRVIPAQFQDVLDLGEDRGQDLMTTWIQRALALLEDVDIERLMADA